MAGEARRKPATDSQMIPNSSLRQIVTSPASAAHNFLRAPMSKKAKKPLVILWLRAFWRRSVGPSQQSFDGLRCHLFADDATGIVD